MLHQGRKHILFSLPVFTTELFQTYQVELIAEVMVETGAGVGGRSISIEWGMDLALPGVRNSLHKMHSEVYNVSQDIMRIKATVSEFRVRQDDVNN